MFTICEVGVGIGICTLFGGKVGDTMGIACMPLVYIFLATSHHDCLMLFMLVLPSKDAGKIAKKCLMRHLPHVYTSYLHC